jgi:uncharacterized membrane protein YbaN (DUF454 family)
MSAPLLPAGDGAVEHAGEHAARPVANSAHQARTPGNPLARALWLSAGTLMLACGVIGVVVPGWPTTIFVILALACYARSSQRLYDRVAANRLVGRQARAFRESGVMPRRAKLFALGMMWPFVGFAVFAGIPDGLLWAQLLTLALAVTGTAYILRLPSEPR